MGAKTLSIFGGIIIIVILGVFFFFWRGGEEPDFTGDSSGFIISNNAIYVTEQKPGAGVLVSVIRLEKPGFVAIHEDASGTPGKIFGVSSLLPTGETKNLPPITLDRATTDGETIYAMLHLDNGDGKFEITNDKPVLDSVGGMPMMMVVPVGKDAIEPGVIIINP